MKPAPGLKVAVYSYWKSILWMLIICLFLFIPGDQIPAKKLFGIPGIDKVVHLLIFMFLEWLLLFDSGIIRISGNNQKILKVSMAAFGFAVLTELMQRYLISSRHGDIDDLIVDLIGIFIALLTYSVFYKIIGRLFFPKS
jgi:VanZ family protein